MAGGSLRGRTAVITGAARRIGHATALALAAQGVHIVVHYRTAADEARDLQRQLQQQGVKSWALAADFSRSDDCEGFIERALAAAGSLDILINNASEFPADTLDGVNRERLLAMVEVNAWAPLVLSRSFARRVGRGKIINLLDSRVQGYDREHVAYSASKHLLALFTRMMALEFAPAFTVNAVAPGLILPPPGRDDAYLDELGKTVPLRRHGDPQEVAQAIIFLAQSDFITGQVIYVDGGRHLAGG